MLFVAAILVPPFVSPVVLFKQQWLKTMAYSLLTNGLPVAKRAKNDLYVTPGNTLSRKMLDPCGANGLDQISIPNLWIKASKGDEHVPRYTEYAIPDD